MSDNPNWLTGENLIWSKPKSNPYGAYNPDQINLSQSLGPEINRRSTGGYGQYLYGGQLNAPISQGEQDVVDNSARLNALADGTFSQIGTYDPKTFNDQFDSEIADPTFNSYKRNVLPGIQEAVPGFSTARANVTARGLQNVSDTLSQERNTARENQKQLALNALSGASNYNVNAANIAAIPRTIQQAGLDRQYNDFIQANSQYSNSIQQALAFLGLSSGTYQPGQSLGEFLIAAGKTAAQAAAAGGH